MLAQVCMCMCVSVYMSVYVHLYVCEQVSEEQAASRSSIWKRPLDCVFIVYFVAASILAVLRFIVSLPSLTSFSVLFSALHSMMLLCILANFFYDNCHMVFQIFEVSWISRNTVTQYEEKLSQV